MDDVAIGYAENIEDMFKINVSHNVNVRRAFASVALAIVFAWCVIPLESTKHKGRLGSAGGRRQSIWRLKAPVAEELKEFESPLFAVCCGAGRKS